ncbi:MAG: type I 3-dehydroquinate dehydratase [Treponemataceae bacterium]|nr:type I 3-dehydroquinate dehydratase [Treponemataceae bacterium]
MMRSKVCLSLTGSTLAENLTILDKYRKWIDVAELRADYLNPDERLQIRKFPELAKIPCILSIRRAINGGKFTDGEAARTVLFARGIAFANQDSRKNFAYIDIESDFNVPSIQDAALAFGTRIIRSSYIKEEPIGNLYQRINKLRVAGFEIPKISYEPRNLSDITQLFHQAKQLKEFDQIIAVRGQLALPSRILATKLHSLLTYTLPRELLDEQHPHGGIDPISLSEIYNFNSIDDKTNVFAVTGYPMLHTLSPKIHNEAYKAHNMNNIFIPLRAQKIEESIEFAEELSVKAITITSPFKNSVKDFVPTIDENAGYSSTCDSIVRENDLWSGHNFCVKALTETLCEFIGRKNLFGLKVAIIGAGSEARTAGFVVKSLRGKACVFNNPISQAKKIAEMYGFKYSSLTEESIDKLSDYADLIIQTKAENADIMRFSGLDTVYDPIPFYEFTGNEYVFDCTYNPQQNPLLVRAERAGCNTANSFDMIQRQAKAHFELFTGVPYDKQDSDTE